MMEHGTKKEEKEMTLGPALAKIMQANSHEELETAADDFTAAYESFKQEMDALITSVLSGHTGENNSLPVPQKAASN